MANLAIDVDRISKRYNIGKLADQQLSMQKQIGNALLAPVRRIGGLLRGNAYAAADLTEEFWALKDVSFQIQQGEVVAIIGRNGAGKSTLLKVLSRITEPTSGRAVINGRVGSLLEVGTGFHPELTGRENVFLNGSILGMSRAEVDRKFDEIVAFSEIETFIDTPTKHYSSGMRVRLAFAVAAHLEPEVLFVDEVLAVGDAAFRRKCMDKVREIGEGGSTVIVVSHNAQAISSMCERAIWLEQGQVMRDGPVGETLNEYLGKGVGLSGERHWGPESNRGGDIVQILATRVLDKNGKLENNIDVRDDFYIETEIEVLKQGHGIVVKHDFFTSEGMGVFATVDTESETWEGTTWEPGVYLARTLIPGNFLQMDSYPIGVALWVWSSERRMEFAERDTVCVHIVNSREGVDATCGFPGAFIGPVRPIMKWEVEPKRISNAASA